MARSTSGTDAFPPEPIDGLILAAGRGTRLGLGDKAKVLVAGRTMLEHCTNALQPQVRTLMLNTREPPGRLEDPWVDDGALAGQGPLAGVLAGLRACDAELLMVLPVDAVRVPRNLVQRLRAALGQSPAAFVADHYTCLLLRRCARDGLEAYLNGGGRAVHRWLARTGATPVSFADQQESIWSINTPDDLARARRSLEPS